ARRRAGPLRGRTLHQLPRAHAPERPVARTAGRNLGAHRLPGGAHRAGARDGFAARGAWHRRDSNRGRLPMKTRMGIMLAVVGAFLLAIGSYKFLQIKAAIAQGAAWRPPPEAVTTIVAHDETWPSTLTPIGSVAAVHGRMVSADLPGMVERIAFDSGHPVRAGALLVRLDTRQERAQLAAAEAQGHLAVLDE